MRGIVSLVILLGCGLTTTVSAQEPVKFDSRSLFSCAEVKPPQQADAAQKVVVIVIPISANFNTEESTVENLHYEFRFPKSVTVLDQYPKTQTGTDLEGLTQKQREEHQLTDLKVKFGGEGRVAFSAFGFGVNLGGGAEREKREFNEVKETSQTASLPPRGQVVVAGTADDGQTLYFDLRWFNQITRAGRTDYAFLAEVPRDWTGDVATLACTARQSGAVAGRLTKAVGLYLNGDNAARQRVEKQLETAWPGATADEKELVTNSVGTKLKLLPAGWYLMGATPDDTAADKDEKPQHKVTITRPFYLGVCEVTQYEYRQVMNDNPSKFKDSELLPVENVSWLDAVKFCNKLSERERRKPYYKIEDNTVTIFGGNGYRLPTEAEWEYACRAPQSDGSATKHPFGDNDADLSRYAWFSENSAEKTHQVGQKKPNRWGLYDMQGNVWEWCQDFYSADYYSFSPESDPPGPVSASVRVFRGGSWDYGPGDCRPAFRFGDGPDNRDSYLRFRLAAD